MFDLLFDPPSYLLVALLLAGAVLLFNGLSRGVKAVKTAGIVAIIAAIVLYAAGRFVETDTEKVTRLTGDLVAAADRKDWATFSGLLDPKVRFAIYAGREQLTKGAELTMDRAGVKNVSTGAYEVKAEPGGYQVAFTATADVEVVGHRTPTNWRFYWAKSPTKDGYLLYRVDALPNPQFGSDPVMSRLVSPR